MPVTRLEWIGLFAGFIRRIGLPIEETEISEPTFLPGTEIRDGVLRYDPGKLLYPGDLLHEAGHLALVPAAERPVTGGNVADGDPNRHGDEMAVMLWTYAAALELDIPPGIVFHADGYKGQNEWLTEQYRAGNYIGLPLLQWMELTDAHFPRMKRWLRE